MEGVFGGREAAGVRADCPQDSRESLGPVRPASYPISGRAARSRGFLAIVRSSWSSSSDSQADPHPAKSWKRKDSAVSTRKSMNVMNRLDFEGISRALLPDRPVGIGPYAYSRFN
jgi:hypothetical protein